MINIIFTGMIVAEPCAPVVVIQIKGICTNQLSGISKRRVDMFGKTFIRFCPGGAIFAKT